MQKHSILDVWRGSEYASAEKQGRCKLFKKNIHCHYVLNLRDMYISMILVNAWLRKVMLENLWISFI